MTAVFIALVLILGLINRFAYYGNTANADIVLNLISANNGDLPESVPDSYKGILDDFAIENNAEFYRSNNYDERIRSFSKITDETLSKVSYFTVTLNASGGVVRTDTAHTSSVDSAEAVSMVEVLRGDKPKERGYVLPYRYLVKHTPMGSMYIFLDCTSELTSALYLALFSVLIAIAGMVLVFVLVLLLSRRVVRQLEDSYGKQKQFITNAGHELKTPLAIINSCTEVIELETGETKWTEGIHEQVARLTTMTSELITMTKMQEASAKLEKAGINVSMIAESVLEPFTLLAEEKGFTMKLDITPDVYMYANQQMIEQLCSILADNAVKYATPGTEIVLGVKRARRRIVVFSDNACEGMAKGNHKEFFERFYRGDPSHSSEKKGYGIGLSTAYTIVDAHGGKISATAEEENRLQIIASFPDRRIRPSYSTDFINIE